MSNGEIPDHLLMRPGIGRIFENLSHRYRRLILILLKQGAVETQADVMTRSGNEREESEIPLIHNHLPRLDEAGYIDWDRDTGAISKGPRFNEVEPLLTLIETHADELPPDWPRIRFPRKILLYMILTRSSTSSKRCSNSRMRDRARI